MTKFSVNREELQDFMQKYESLGGKVNQQITQVIKESIEEHRIEPEHLHKGLKLAFENEQFMNWANVLKHIREVSKPIPSYHKEL